MKIKLSTLRRIIREELSNLRENEAMDEAELDELDNPMSSKSKAREDAWFKSREAEKKKERERKAKKDE